MITIPTAGPEDLGRVFLLAEIAVAVAGWGLRINPFDQPNVQQAKDATNRVLEGFEKNGELPDVPAAGEAELRELLLGAAPPDYVALMGYLQPSEDVRRRRRRAARDGARRHPRHDDVRLRPALPPLDGAVPQGRPEGRPLPAAAPRRAGATSRSRAGRYDFGTLKEAQAIGDVETLRELGLPAQRVRLEGVDSASALRALTATIKGWT